MTAATMVIQTPCLEGNLPCHILVLYGDTAAYDSAIETCRRVLARFDGELPFAFNCSSFDKLSSPLQARRVGEAVAHADIIIVSLSAHGSSASVLGFLNRCAITRSKKEGALALLASDNVAATTVNEAVLAGFSIVAQRLGMDLLVVAPTSGASEMGSPEGGAIGAITAAAMQTPRPSLDHWGLNE